MSRVARAPMAIPKGVELKLDGKHLLVKAGNAALQMDIPAGVDLVIDGDTATISEDSIAANAAMAGTVRACVNNMITGVSKGFERKLTLIGVGYRAQAQGKKLNLSLGFSHPIEFEIPEGISIETPSQTEIVVKGTDKQLVGQVAANIRRFRPPEPYKGKGVRYHDERVAMKEAKKK